MVQMAHMEIIGNLGQDPTTEYTPKGTEVVTMSVAVNSYTKGKRDDEPTWYVVQLYGRLAEIFTTHAENGRLRKGTQIYAEGMFKQRLWTDRDGNTRVENKITADNAYLLGSPND